MTKIAGAHWLRGLLRQKRGAAIIREPCEHHKTPNATTSFQNLVVQSFVCKTPPSVLF